MARRYYRRRGRYRRKRSNPAEAIIGIIVLFVALGALHSGNGNASFEFETLIVGLFQVGLFVLVIYALYLVLTKRVRSFLNRLVRKKLFKQNRSIEELLMLHPQSFEEYVGGVYEQQGYKVEKVTSYSRDHGIDLVLKSTGKRYAVQVKRYAKHNYVKAREV